MAYEVVSLHIKSKTNIDFFRPETVIGNVRVLEDLLHETFRDSTVVLMEKVGNNLLAAFSIRDNNNNNYNFQYSQLGDLATLIESLLKKNDVIAILHNVQDGDHFTMSYTNKDKFPSLLITFLQRRSQENCLNVLIISEDEKRRLQSFLDSSKGDHNDKSTTDFIDNNTLIVTHSELYGDLDSVSSFSLQPFMDGLNQAREIAIQKQMSGLNIVGTLAGALYSKGRFEECLQIEEQGHQALRQFPMPITVMCLYEKPIDEPHQTPLLRCHNGGLHQI
jgi:hypothetical protein